MWFDVFKHAILNSIRILTALLLILTFSDSCKHTVLLFSENISNNINISWEIYTFSEFMSNYTHILRDFLQDNTIHFFKDLYQTILTILANLYQIILFSAFISSNSDTISELLPNNTTYIFEFISINTDIRETLISNTHFLRIHTKQFWHFQRVTFKQYHKRFFRDHIRYLTKYFF